MGWWLWGCAVGWYRYEDWRAEMERRWMLVGTMKMKEGSDGC